MHLVNLYIRVSTDEQADKGFSQRYQEEVLKNYCELNQLHVNAVFFEDHSAKDFNRPEWNRLLRLYKKSKKDRPRQILFTKWDRFSRNTGHAYSMIRTLETLGIGVTAIEQPLDLNIPENRLMLAVYLATPEVENIRRGLNIKQGIRRAKKEGRCTGMAPIGFANMTTENGQKYITPVKPLADIMRMSFERIASKTYNIAQAYRSAVDNGFNKSKNCFWRAIRNPLYCGKILIPATETEIERYVQAVHTPIISEATFFKVQQIINRKMQKSPKRSINEDLLPLRGFLICKSCGKIMTGSGSQGNSKKYFYYHCRSSCGCRLRADNAHQLLYDVLRSFKLSETYLPFCEKVLKQTIAMEHLFKTQTASHLTKRINELTNKINRSRELLLKGDIDGDDYKRIKSDCEIDLKILTEKLSMQQTKSRQLSKDVNAGLKLFSKLHHVYDEGDIQIKRLLLSVIFKDYLISDGGNICRTKLNNTMNVLYNQEAAFTGPCSSVNLRGKVFPLFSLEDQPEVIWQNHINLLKLGAGNKKNTQKHSQDVAKFIQQLARCIAVQINKPDIPN